MPASNPKSGDQPPVYPQQIYGEKYAVKKDQTWLPHHSASHRPAGSGYDKKDETPAAGCDVEGDPECSGYAGRGAGPL